MPAVVKGGKMTRHAWCLVLPCALVAVGCQPTVPQAPVRPAPRWVLSSPKFPNNGRIPATFTCHGESISPPLSWANPPAGTKQLALICEDLDAPKGRSTHWVLWGVSPDLRSLPRAIPTSDTVPALGGAKQGRNDFGRIGYTAPCCHSGEPEHRYSLRLYALDSTIKLKPDSYKADLLQAMDKHIVDQAELIGTYFLYRK